MHDWTGPFQLYEAICPFAVWLNSYGLVNDDVMAHLTGLMFFLTEQSDFIADRQAYWVELVFLVKTAVNSILGIE